MHPKHPHSPRATARREAARRLLPLAARAALVLLSLAAILLMPASHAHP